MFNYIRRKIVGKNDDATTNSPEASRTRPSDQNNTRAGTKPAQASNEIRENENATLTRKDVVNLLIPPTDYSSHKTGVTAILHNIMAGSRKRNRSKHKNRHKNKNQIIRAESYKEISTEVPEDMQINVNLYRSHSQLDKPYASREETLSAPVSASDLTYDLVEAKNNFGNELINSNETHANSPADFVKELVLHKYKNKTETKRPHVSLIYVSNEQGGEQINNAIDSDLYETIAVSQTQLVGQEAERQHALTESIPNTIDKQYKDAKQALLNEDPAKHRAEALLKEIAKRIDYKLNDKTESMGADASKNNDEKYRNNIDHKHENEAKTTSMNAFKDSLKNELDNLLQSDQAETVLHEKPGYENPVYHEVPKSAIEESLIREKEEVCLDIENEKLKFFEPQKTESDIEDQQMLECLENRKKSNLKPPRSDTEGCSDDDRSDCGRKKVTFKKVIHFDDGDQQTDEEIDSSFGSLASSEEEEEESDSELPDNDELLGGVVVTRAEDKVVITEIADDEENYLNSNFNAIIDFVDETDDLKISETPDHFNELEKSAKTKFETDLSEHKFKSSDDIQDLNTDSKVKSDCETDIHRINSDNSDSGFIEFNEKADVKEAEESVTDSDGETEEVTDSEEEEEDEESSEGGVVIAEVVEQEDLERDDLKTLVTQEDKFQAQVAQLSELANTRCGEAERVREQLARHRKEIESRDQEIERLKCDLAAAYKESELIRQRSRSLEDDLAAAKSCSAHLAEKLARYNDGTERALRAELEAAQTRAAELESRLLALEKEKARLEHEKQFQEQKALEALEAAEASSARWKSAHEAARSQAAARAERLLADCEWKMRELEKRAREADKQKTELTAALQKAQSETPSAAQQAELQQLRGFASEQQRSVQALTAQLQRLETREDALKVEVHRLKELLEREAAIAREKEERQAQALSRLEQSHAKRIESVRSELSAQQAATRSALERAHAERTRNALAQLRLEHERDCRNAERKLREAQARFDNLKEVLASKESQFEESIAEAHSKADWELLQLRHLLDKTDIAYANKIEEATEKHESEIERLNAEWSGRLEQAEQAAASAAGEAKSLLESTRARLEAERVEQVNRLKEEHRIAMEEQWEQFMSDKEAGLARMKLECRQEGEEERSRRERDLLDEIADLKSQIESKSASFDELADKAASCGRTLAVTEQELREALEREKLLRMQRSEDSDKIKQAKNASRNEVEHLTRKCACLRKLFDDMRTRLAAREKVTAEESRAQQREIQQLKAEVARLTKILVEQSSPKLGARTRADGCDSAPITDESFFSKAGLQASESQPSAPRRKGGTLRTPELPRKRSNTAELKTLANMMENMRPTGQDAVGRRRAKSVDLPAVQVPVRIKQLEDRNK